jgi:hypothetical protein
MKCEACEASAAEVLVDSHRRAPEFHHLCFDCGRQIRKESPHMMLQPDVAATERAILSVLLTGPRNAMDLKIATDHTSPRDVKRLDNRLQALKRGLHVTLDGQRWAITPAGMSYAEVLGVDVKPQRAKPEPKQQPPKQQPRNSPPPQLEEPGPIPAPAPAVHEAMPVVPEAPEAPEVPEAPVVSEVPGPVPGAVDRAALGHLRRSCALLVGGDISEFGDYALADMVSAAVIDLHRRLGISDAPPSVEERNLAIADLRAATIEMTSLTGARHFLRSALAEFAKLRGDVLAETPDAQLVHAAKGVVKYDLQEAVAHERSVALGEAGDLRRERDAALAQADDLQVRLRTAQDVIRRLESDIHEANDDYARVRAELDARTPTPPAWWNPKTMTPLSALTQREDGCWTVEVWPHDTDRGHRIVGLTKASALSEALAVLLPDRTVVPVVDIEESQKYLRDAQAEIQRLEGLLRTAHAERQVSAPPAGVTLCRRHDQVVDDVWHELASDLGMLIMGGESTGAELALNGLRALHDAQKFLLHLRSHHHALVGDEVAS